MQTSCGHLCPKSQFRYSSLASESRQPGTCLMRTIYPTLISTKARRVTCRASETVGVAHKPSHFTQKAQDWNRKFPDHGDV